MDTSQLRGLLERVRTIAVVGCSRYPHKAAHAVPRQLQAAGFRIIPVHPTAGEIMGERAHPRLADVDVPVDVVDVFRPPGEAADVTRQAIDIGARAVWLQMGITSAQARRLAADAGIDYVEDRCLAVEVGRLGIRHKAR